MAYDYEYFKKAVFDLTTIDLNAYKEKQMKRRIDTLIDKRKADGYDKYIAMLKSDKEAFEEFVSSIAIPTSGNLWTKKSFPSLYPNSART